MANPSGSTYLQANSGYVWTDGDIYEIVQTDQNEGGTPGITSGAGAASFSGLGVVNQPHQVLLNKIQYTHTHQLADEVNISNLLTFQGLFTSSIGTIGWKKVGVRDVNRGQIDIIEQWGTAGCQCTISGGPARGFYWYTGGASFTFPIRFPSACAAVWTTPDDQPNNLIFNANVHSFTPAGFSVNVHSALPTEVSFYWRAIGW